MCILGAVFVERVEIEPLTDYIWLGSYPHHDFRLRRVARILKALATGLRNLDEFYRTLTIVKSDSRLSSRLFPYIRSYTISDELVHFRYVSRLAAGNPEKAIFRAKKERDGGDIVVKFTYRYNAKAHQVLARQGLSPTLFYIGDTHSSALTSPNGLYGAPKMVIMEFLQGSSAEVMYYRAPPPSFVYEDVLAAISALHKEGFVFGDLRRPNIMVSRNTPSRNTRRAKLVDFDWCGQDGHDRYPSAMNMSIDWHEDVNRDAVMRKEHDLFMLKALYPVTLTSIKEDVEVE